MRDDYDDPAMRYDYERGSLPTKNGMLEGETPTRGLVSIFSDNKKQGPWELPRHMRVLAIFGSATIDLRDALIGPGVSVIEALSIFGNIEVIVPPEIMVECDGDAFLGSFTMQRKKRGPGSISPPPGAPVVRVTGDAYASSVSVLVKAPRGESALNRLGRKIGLD